TGGGLDQIAANMQGMGAGMQSNAVDLIQNLSRAPQDTWMDILNQQKNAHTWYSDYGQAAAQPFQKAFQNWQDIQNQFLAANQQEFNQNQISGFEDPFALLQLQSQIEMEREQMNMQEKMQERQMKQQQGMQGAQMGMGLLSSMMGGK